MVAGVHVFCFGYGLFNILMMIIQKKHGCQCSCKMFSNRTKSQSLGTYQIFDIFFSECNDLKE